MESIPLADAEIAFDPHWLTSVEADDLFAALMAQISWETHRLRLFGREMDAPRLSCWIGDPDAVYTYSRMRFEPRPWPAALLSSTATRVSPASTDTSIRFLKWSPQRVGGNPLSGADPPCSWR